MLSKSRLPKLDCLLKMQSQEFPIIDIVDGRNPLIILVGFNWQLIHYKLPLIVPDIPLNELLP